MKKLTFIIVLVSALFNFNSCKKFLDTKPTDSLTPGEYYSTEAKLTSALAGVYDMVTSEGLYGNYLWLEWNGCTDDGYYARSAVTTGLMVNNFDYSNDRITLYWSACYTGIERANQLITNINIPVMDAAKRDAILGEALFLRGYYYFLLVTRFGDVPVRLEPTLSPNNADLARTPIADVYKQILKDMTDAEAKVNTSTAMGHASRISKTVVQGILARVCLQMAGYPLNDNTKYAQALAWAKKVQTSGEHSLRTTFNAALTNSAYSQIFINHSQDIYDVKESMWEADFLGTRSDGYIETGRVGNTMGITMTSVAFQADTGYCYGFIKGTGRLFKLYGNGDLRKAWSLATYTYNNTTGARVNIAATANTYGRDAGKWRRSYELQRPKNKNHGPANFPILRYADVLLMLAEAENQVNGPTAIAYDAINQVRRRGYGLPIGTPNVTSDLTPGLSKNDFQLALEDERSRELCFEGLRREDLVRWGKLVNVMHAVAADQRTNGAGFAYSGLGGENIADRHRLYPIPASEITVNKLMTQNTGW